MIFSTAAWQIAEAHAKLAPTYVYRYDFAPRTLHWTGFGATHATELLAVFGIYRSRVGAVLTAGVDQRAAVKVSHQVQTRWNEFARTGVPGDDWPVYNREERPVLVFDRTHPRRVRPAHAPPAGLGEFHLRQQQPLAGEGVQDGAVVDTRHTLVE